MTKEELNKKIMVLMDEVSNIPEEIEGYEEGLAEHGKLQNALCKLEDALRTVYRITR